MVATIYQNHEERALHISVELSADPAEYAVWNIQNAARVLVTKPEERQITLAVYRCHRNALGKKGVKEDILNKYDKALLHQVSIFRENYKEKGINAELLRKSESITLDEIRGIKL
ncbi:MAG: hypothetical protein Q7S74_01910 [Nanoarchaeota archaeon]|nr:hypothetical protein [Nanoarchaeota archaeon]